jgi:hypothetical protein
MVAQPIAVPGAHYKATLRNISEIQIQNIHVYLIIPEKHLSCTADFT